MEQNHDSQAILLQLAAMDHWATQKGISMASRCYSRHGNNESDIHLFFYCSLAQKLWQWLLRQDGTPLAPPLLTSSIWTNLAKGVDGHGRKSAAAIFFQAIYTLWFLRNEAKHRSVKPSLKQAQLVFLDNSSGMFCSSSGRTPPSHPILKSLGWVD